MGLQPVSCNMWILSLFHLFFLYCTELAEVPRPHADRVRQVAADPWANTIHDAHFVIDDEHVVDNNIIIYRDARKKLQSCRK